jgi:hypothetical protein
MAPTNAKAMYAVNTPNLPTKGRKVIAPLPLTSLLAVFLEQGNNAFFGKKVRLAVYAPHNRG